MIVRSKKKHKAPKRNITIYGKILEMVNQTKCNDNDNDNILFDHILQVHVI